MAHDTATATLPPTPALGRLTAPKVLLGLALLAIVVVSLLDLFCVVDLANLC